MIGVKNPTPDEENSLAYQYPNIIPRYESYGTYDPDNPFNYHWGFGTNQNRADAGLTRNYDGYSAYGSLSLNNKLPELERNWNTPVGDISLKVNTERPGAIARYSANNTGNIILDALVKAYNRNRVFDKEYNQYKPPDTPGYPYRIDW